MSVETGVLYTPCYVEFNNLVIIPAESPKVNDGSATIVLTNLYPAAVFGGHYFDGTEITGSPMTDTPTNLRNDLGRDDFDGRGRGQKSYRAGPIKSYLIESRRDFQELVTIPSGVTVTP
jgi:hypothetical protein